MHCRWQGEVGRYGSSAADQLTTDEPRLARTLKERGDTMEIRKGMNLDLV